MYHLNQIPSEAQCQKLFRQVLFGKNVSCPVCRCRKVDKDRQRYWCPRCRRRFTLLSHTWLRGTKLTYQQIYLILWCWCNAYPVRRAQEFAEFSEEAVRHWYALFRAHVPETSCLLTGTVQLDEAYGRGWSLLLAKQIGSRRLAYELHPTGKWFQRHQARQFIQSCVAPGSTVNTDGSHLYFEMEKYHTVKHQVDIHTKFEFSQTSEIEGMFGVFRTFLRRMYHHVTAEKIPEYVREFCARFSSPAMFKEPSIYLKKTLKAAPLD